MILDREVTLLNDESVRAIPVVDNGDALVRWPRKTPPGPGESTATPLVREGLAYRLARAEALLPPGVHLLVVEGFRTAASQRAIIDAYTAQLRVEHPFASDDELLALASRFVSPLEVAPHVAGAAVDVTLVDPGGREYDMGTPIDATPEQSHGDCYFDAPVSAPARACRAVLGRALTQAGLVNYPTEWWHWSYGDRYWALMTGARHAVYGAVIGEPQPREIDLHESPRTTLGLRIPSFLKASR